MTKKTTLSLASNLELPIDAVTQKLAFLGRTGSGKTFGCKRMVEEMLRAHAQVVIIDPVGVWPGLRLGPKSFDVPVLGGLYGDIPLEAGAGAVVADIVVDRGTSIILDVSQMLDAERTRFCTAFGERFFLRKKSSPSAVHVVLEECQEIVPQNPQSGEERMLHEWQRIAKLGRNFGIGVSFISQRPQEVAKKALNQAECVFAFQLTGPQERKALQYWLSDRGADEKLADVLPTLKVGAPHVWSPQWLRISKVVSILPISTLDTSQTPKVGQRAFAAPKLTPIDLAELGAAMKATIERAKADDPKALRAEIASLKKQLGQGAKPAVAVPAAVDRVEVEVFDEKRFGEVFEAISRHVDNVAASAANAKSDIGRLLVSYRNECREKRKKPLTVARVAAAPKQLPAAARLVKAGEPDPALGNSGLRRILIVLAQRSGGASDSQIAILTGIARTGGTFRTYVGKGKTLGWIEGDSERRAITDAGVIALGSYDPLPTGPDLLAYWLRELGTSGASRMLSAVAEAYDGMTREQLAEATDIELTGGTFRTYLGKLKTLELVSEEGGLLKLSEELR